MRKVVLAGLMVTLVACASMRQPTPARGVILTDDSVSEAVPGVMAELEELGYRIESVERDAGLVKGVKENALAALRVTVTLREDPQNEGLRFRVVGQASSGPSTAEEIAREVRRHLHGRFND